MRIGIGVTTYKRPEHIAFWNEQVKKYLPKDAQVYIATDSPTRKGIAFRKNECLKALKHCDYIFLFDDDCFPVKDGWVEWFIEMHLATEQHHFLYLKETGTIKKIDTQSEFHFAGKFVYEVNIYNSCGGCFMFLTKEVIEKVGGYNPNYGIYGYEHAGYSNRIHAAGLTPMGKYLCPAGAGEYIYSMDYDWHLPFNKQVNHKPSLINEMEKVPGYIEQNARIYLQDTEIFQPL